MDSKWYLWRGTSGHIWKWDRFTIWIFSVNIGSVSIFIGCVTSDHLSVGKFTTLIWYVWNSFDGFSSFQITFLFPNDERRQFIGHRNAKTICIEYLVLLDLHNIISEHINNHYILVGTTTETSAGYINVTPKWFDYGYRIRCILPTRYRSHTNTIVRTMFIHFSLSIEHNDLQLLHIDAGFEFGRFIITNEH